MTFVNIQQRQMTVAEFACAAPDLKLDERDRKTMEFCLKSSKPLWGAEIDGKLACLWGLIPPTLMSNRAYLWLYAADSIKDHTFLLVRHSQLVIEQMLEEYEIIVGHCALSSTRSIRWLKWLGATFGEPEGRTIPFKIRKRKWIL